MQGFLEGEIRAIEDADENRKTAADATSPVSQIEGGA